MCGNRLCGHPDRQFRRIDAIAPHVGAWRNQILAFRYHAMYGWGHIFARLFVAHLDDTGTQRAAGLIVANPAYEPPAVAGWPRELGRIELVLQYARDYDPWGRWPWDDPHDPAIVKIGPTDSSAGTGLQAREAKAAQLREKGLLAVPHPDRVASQRVLVLDDVFTTGHTLNEVARVLRRAGATSVDGLVLARALWT